jgi:hypothetical protein
VRSRIARAKDQLRTLIGQTAEFSSLAPDGTIETKTSSYPMTKGVR